MDPLRVVVLDHTAELGGAELALGRLLDELATRQDAPHVTVVLWSDGPLVERLRARGHTVEVVPLDPRLASMDRHRAGRLAGARGAVMVVPHAVRLAKLVRRCRADLIYTTSLKADLVGVPVALLSGRPLVWHVHDRIAEDYLPRPMVQLIRVLARVSPRAVIANSTATAATLPGARGLRVAHPGLSREQFTTGPRTIQPDGPPVIGVIGRISPTKAQLDFVRAAAAALRTVPDARFLIVGEPAFGAQGYAAQVRSEISRLHLSEQVELTGFTDDPTAVLDGLTLCVHTASVPEPFGQVVTEAMARGVPVVATTGGGVDEIFGSRAAAAPIGFAVPAGDVTALADAMIVAVTNPAEALERAERAHAHARRMFPIERTADTILATWREVVR